MDKEIIDVRVNNSTYKITAFSTKPIRKNHVIIYANSNGNKTKLDRNFYNPIKEIKRNDFIIPCHDRICSECGQDHSFTSNFEGVKISIDVLPELFRRHFVEREALSN